MRAVFTAHPRQIVEARFDGTYLKGNAPIFQAQRYPSRGELPTRFRDDPQKGELHPEVELTGRFKSDDSEVDLRNVMREIDDARKEAERRRLLALADQETEGR